MAAAGSADVPQPGGYSLRTFSVPFASHLCPVQKLDAACKSRIRSFGHVQLCGVLHACWQTKESVDGLYLICLLYRDYLCLASAGKVEQVYTIQALIARKSLYVEEVDNNRGWCSAQHT